MGIYAVVREQLYGVNPLLLPLCGVQGLELRLSGLSGKHL